MPAPSVLLGSVDALERRLATDVAELQRTDPLKPVVVLVGETLLRAYLRRRIAELSGPYLNVHIVTPGELALRLGELPLVLAGQKPLPLLADRVLAQEAAASTAGYFDAVSTTPGFGHALHRTLVEIRRAGISPDALERAASTALEPEKTRALAELAARHHELRAGHYDADSSLAAADPDRLGADQLLVYGLWDPPVALRNALAAIAETRPLTVYLPAADPVADLAHEDFRQWLESALDATTTELSSEIAELTSAAMRIVSAPDPNREVRDALRTCLRWARDDGIAFHEMAIVYRHSDPYRSLLEAALREANLPAYLNEGTPLSELPLGRRALALMDLMAGDLERAAVIAFAADAGFPSATRQRFPGTAAAWDGFSRKAGVVRGWEQWRDRLSAFREREAERTDAEGQRPDWLDQRLEQIDGLREFVTDLVHRKAGRPTDASWREHLAHLSQTLEQYVDGHEPITDALAGLARLDGLTAAVSIDRFDRTVRSIIQGLSAEDARPGRAGAFRARGINVLDANSVRHMRFRAVCVVGLAERQFPPAPREDPLLLDAERQQLNEQHRWRLPLRARGADPEPLQFEVAAGAAAERLQLSYPRTDHGSARPLFASGFLRGAAQTLLGQRVTAEEFDEITTDWFVRLPGGRIGARQLDDALDNLDYDRTLVEQMPAEAIPVISAARPAVARGRTAWIARRFDPLLTPYDGGLTGASLAALETHPKLAGPTPPSAFERYAQCGLQFFLSRVLGLRALEEPEDLPRMTPMDRGSLVHSILERVLAQLLPADPPAENRRGAHLQLIDQVAAEEFERAEARGLTGHPQLWEIDKSVMGAELRLWYDEEVLAASTRRWDSAAFEVSYGIPLGDEPHPLSTTAPVPLTFGTRTVQLSGKIDRLQWDERGRGFAVIDYKTGRQRDKKAATFDGGRALQLPLYLHGAGHLLGRAPTDGTAEYFYVSRRGRFARHELTGATLAESSEAFEQIMGAFAEGMFGGLYPARPEARLCSYCDFRGLCPHPAEHVDRMKVKESDPRLEELQKARDIP
jgi:ATP-dependent helicase/nuclease subunit B